MENQLGDISESVNKTKNQKPCSLSLLYTRLNPHAFWSPSSPLASSFTYLFLFSSVVRILLLPPQRGSLVSGSPLVFSSALLWLSLLSISLSLILTLLILNMLSQSSLILPPSLSFTLPPSPPPIPDRFLSVSTYCHFLINSPVFIKNVTHLCLFLNIFPPVFSHIYGSFMGYAVVLRFLFVYFLFFLLTLVQWWTQWNFGSTKCLFPGV